MGSLNQQEQCPCKQEIAGIGPAQRLEPREDTAKVAKERGPGKISHTNTLIVDF